MVLENNRATEHTTAKNFFINTAPHTTYHMPQTENNTIYTDVTIVGGNIVGAATALSLQNIGLSVALIEKNPPNSDPFELEQPYSLRVSAIIPVVKNLLQELGVWQHLLPARVQEVYKMQVWENSLQHALDFTQSQTSDAPYSSLAWIVENNHIQHTCWQLLDDTLCHKIIGEWQTIAPLANQQGYQIVVNNEQKKSQSYPDDTK